MGCGWLTKTLSLLPVARSEYFRASPLRRRVNRYILLPSSSLYKPSVPITFPSRPPDPTSPPLVSVEHNASTAPACASCTTRQQLRPRHRQTCPAMVPEKMLGLMLCPLSDTRVTHSCVDEAGASLPFPAIPLQRHKSVGWHRNEQTTQCDVSLEVGGIDPV